jgi:hypothetical protein
MLSPDTSCSGSRTNLQGTPQSPKSAEPLSHLTYQVVRLKGHYVRRIGNSIQESSLLRIIADDHRINDGITMPRLNDLFKYPGNIFMRTVTAWKDGRYCNGSNFRIFYARRLWGAADKPYVIFEAFVFRDFGGDRVFGLRRNDKHLVERVINK